MNNDLLWPIARTFFSVSLVAIGGATAAVPEIHRQVVDVLHWMNSAQFATLFAIAQVAPGPNVLLISLIGWHMAGLAGLAVATLAMNVPSCLLAFGVGRIVTRVSGTNWFRIAQDALVPIAIGLILATGVDMARAADRDILAVAITAGAALFVFRSAQNPLWAIAAGTLATVIAFHMGLPS